MAKYVAKTQSELNKALEKQVIAWLEEKRRALPELLRSFIMAAYYDEYEPSSLYHRKYRILEAIMASKIVKQGNVYYIEIYLDPDAVSYNPAFWTYYDEYGERHSTEIQGDSSEFVFQNIANGVHGRPEYGVTSGRFWKEFISALQKDGVLDLFEDFKKSLNGKGFLTIKV